MEGGSTTGGKKPLGSGGDGRVQVHAGKQPRKQLPSAAKKRKKPSPTTSSSSGEPKKQQRETTEIAIERLSKAIDRLADEDKKCSQALCKEFAKKARTDIMVKRVKDGTDRIIRTMRDKVSPTCTVMKTRDFELFLNGDLPAGEVVRAFQYDMHRGQRTKGNEHNAETISVVGVLKRNPNVPEDVVQLTPNQVSVDIFVHSDKRRVDLDKRDGLRLLLKFVHTCTSKPSILRRDEDDDEEVEDGGDWVNHLKEEQENVLRNLFLTLMGTYLCQLQSTLDKSMRPQGQYLDKTILYHYIYTHLKA